MTSGQEKSLKALKTTIDGKLIGLDNCIEKIEIKDLNCSSENFIYIFDYLDLKIFEYI